MTYLNAILIICATWYITYCLTALPGPRGIFNIMRSWEYLSVMKCKYCLSFWVGLVFYGFVYVGYTDIVNVFGLVGAGHMLASWTGAEYGETG